MASAADEQVAAAAARERVVAGAADEDIVARPAHQRIAAIAADHRGAATAGRKIIRTRPLDLRRYRYIIVNQNRVIAAKKVHDEAGDLASWESLHFVGQASQRVTYFDDAALCSAMADLDVVIAGTADDHQLTGDRIQINPHHPCRRPHR